MPLEEIGLINGEAVPPLRALVEKIPWNYILRNAKPVFFHGDLQPDNVLVTSEDEFVLLDWRQDFGGEINFGDLYYDLSKLLGGLIIDYRDIRLAKFSYAQDAKSINFSLPKIDDSAFLIDSVKSFCVSQGYDFNKVELLTAVIFCNMAPLHQSPFKELLYALSRERLHHYLKNN